MFDGNKDRGQGVLVVLGGAGVCDVFVFARSACSLATAWMTTGNRRATKGCRRRRHGVTERSVRRQLHAFADGRRGGERRRRFGRPAAMLLRCVRAAAAARRRRAVVVVRACMCERRARRQQQQQTRRLPLDTAAGRVARL